MEHAEASRVGPAYAAPVDAACHEVLATLGRLGPDHRHWVKPSGRALTVIDRLVEHLERGHVGSDRLCPHAHPTAEPGRPRPLVLDAVRGTLVCRDICFVPGRPTAAARPAACLGCGGESGGVTRSDVAITYGPILVVAALCGGCWLRWQAGAGTGD